MERKIIPQNPWNCVNFKLRSCYAINFDVEENAKERLNPRKVIHQVPSTDIRGFQIDNCVFQSDLDFTNLKSQVYYQATLKVTFFQKVWCIFLIAQKMCRKLSWKGDFEIVLCLESADSNCTAVSKGGKIQNTKLMIEHSTFFVQWK